ncbi:MAG TPA: hypothetical protein VJ734_02275 [Nitrosospira sp.]|nr:hypothetical protein [Nitrosospira sp.]
MRQALPISAPVPGQAISNTGRVTLSVPMEIGRTAGVARLAAIGGIRGVIQGATPGAIPEGTTGVVHPETAAVPVPTSGQSNPFHRYANGRDSSKLGGHLRINGYTFGAVSSSSINSRNRSR